MNTPTCPRRVGILTGGGDCPGLNAVIRAVTQSLLRQCGAEVIGIEDGFAGLLCEPPRARRLDWDSVSGILLLGGTILGSSNRANPLASQAATALALANVRRLGLDALVVIGGDGSMTIAHALAQQGLAIVGVPKTIDNDLYGCERSFGFDTAVATVTEALERIQTTAHSHRRVMIVETMGRWAGWIALEAGLAAAADAILLPELDYDLPTLARHCQARLLRERYSVICIGEGAKALGGSATLQAATWPVADPAAGASAPPRLGGVAHLLCQQLQPLLQAEVRATVLGHVQRGGSPTPFDRVLATLYGNQAAQLLLQGHFGRMVTLSGGQLGHIALAEVAQQQRTVPPGHPLLQAAQQIGVCLGQAEPGQTLFYA